MHALLLCFASVAVGIEVGWQRMPEGGMEYIIQLDPQTLETLRAGRTIHSDIPPAAGEVRSYRIVVGTKKLPHETPPTPRPLAPDPGLKPLAERTAAFMQPTDVSGKPQPMPKVDVLPEEPQKPWLPLTVTLLGLFASLGANVFLGWIAWDFRRQLARGC